MSPFVFFYGTVSDLDLVIDASDYGNDARFIRRSCQPNAAVSFQTVLIPSFFLCNILHTCTKMQLFPNISTRIPFFRSTLLMFLGSSCCSRRTGPFHCCSNKRNSRGMWNYNSLWLWLQKVVCTLKLSCLELFFLLSYYHWKKNKRKQKELV